MSRSAHAFAFAVLLATASDSIAAPLVSRARGAAARERVETPGIARTQPLQVDLGALGALRSAQAPRVDAFPLGRDRTVTLTLTRFDPFPPHARVEVVEPDGVRDLPLPDLAYFRGTVEGEPESRVLLLAGADAVRGFVSSGGDVFLFGRRSGSTHVSYRLADVDPTFFPPPGDFCSNDLHPEQVNAAAALRPAALAPPPVAALPLKVADVAVETDQELRAKFAGDQETLDYLAALLAATTTIYERDVSVRLTFSYIRLWNTTDPWTATGTSGALSELLSYWNANMAGQPRDVTHMISGKPVQGGIAYLDVLCLTNWAYGVSQVYGDFDVSSPNDIWDVEVVAHELGHNFGSPHTHCYSPPVDKCYNGESGCWSGAVVPTSDGTVMSYCHLNAGGLANIDLVFGSTVSARIGTSVASASCLSTVTTTSTSATSTSSTSVTSTTSTSSTSTSRTSTTTSTTATTTSTSTSSSSSTSSTSSSSTTSSTATPTTSSSSSTVSTATSSTSSSSSSSTTSTATPTTSSTTSTTSTSTSTTSSSSSTTSTATPTTSSTSSTASTSTSTTSSSSSTASTALSTSTSVTSTSSSTVPSPSSTVTTSTTSTTEPSPRSGGDEDGDGITDVQDTCAGTPAGDLVTVAGCSVCPCDGGVSGWPSRRAYLACVRGEARYRVVAGTLDANGRRYAIRRSRQATCGRPRRTRCCVPGSGCAVVTETTCVARGGESVGAGSCLPSPCD